MSKITVLRSTKTIQDGKGGSTYPVVELAYKTDDGKTKGMKIFGFGNQKENAMVAGNAKPGDVLEAVFQQNAKGYWEFASLKATGETAAKAEPVSADKSQGSAARSNWETSEERAARQVLIVRQSSLSTAVALKPKASVDEVIDVAKKFEEYVMTGKLSSIEQTGDVE